MVAVLSLPDELYENDVNCAKVGNSLYADHVRNAYVPFVRPPEQIRLADYVQYRFSDYVFDIGDSSVACDLCADAFGDLARLPDIFSADDLTQLTFGMGPVNDGVMFHSHTAAWNALMFGEKEWFFYPPDGFIGEPYERLSMVAATSLPEVIGGLESLSAIHPPLRCRQKAGEVIFVPDGWWHATFSHTDTACLGGQRHKDRLPADWGESLLERWPGSGLFLNAVAKERRCRSLFEEAIRKEPANLRFTLEYMQFLRDSGQYASTVPAAQTLKGVMEQNLRQGLLGRAEMAAVLAQLAEVLYHTVETAAVVTTAMVGNDGSWTNSGRAAFAELMQVSVTARCFIEEALTLDPGCPLAGGLAAAIETKARSADLRQLPPKFF
jgi:hypothetical protein